MWVHETGVRPLFQACAPWHFLYFFPLPHGHGSLRPTFGSSRRTVFGTASSPPTRGGCCAPDARTGGGVFGAAERAPKSDELVASALGSVMISGARRGAGRRG